MSVGALALAPAALLGRTGLVVNNHRNASNFTQTTLDGVKVIAVLDPHIIQGMRHHGVSVGPAGRGETGGARRASAPLILLRLVGHDHDLMHALGTQLGDDLGHGETAVQRLPAGHSHCIVIEQLVGDGRPGCDRGTDGQNARMKIGPVAHVGKHVRRLAERCLTNPGRALPAHLRKRIRATCRIPLRHKVTPDPRKRARALGDMRRRVVRTTRAKGRRALQFDRLSRFNRLERLDSQQDRLAFLGLKNRQARLNSGKDVWRKAPPLMPSADQTATNRPRDHCRRMFAVGRKEPIPANVGADFITRADIGI